MIFTHNYYWKTFLNKQQLSMKQSLQITLTKVNEIIIKYEMKEIHFESIFFYFV